jgi:hypothetical protein
MILLIIVLVIVFFFIGWFVGATMALLWVKDQKGKL